MLVCAASKIVWLGDSDRGADETRDPFVVLLGFPYNRRGKAHREKYSRKRAQSPSCLPPPRPLFTVPSSSSLALAFDLSLSFHPIGAGRSALPCFALFRLAFLWRRQLHRRLALTSAPMQLYYTSDKDMVEDYELQVGTV